MNAPSARLRAALRWIPLWVAAHLPVPCWAQQHPSAGLWVGHAYLNEVNEVVSAVDENNVRVQTPPDRTTPASDQAEILLIVHVDDGGAVRLLKSVAVVDVDGDPQTVDESLLTDPALFANFAVARRIAAAAFEFGDRTAKSVVEGVAEAAAAAAAGNPTSESAAGAAALAAAQAAIDLAEDGSYSAAVEAFISSASFSGSAASAAAAAGESVVENYNEGLRGDELRNAVRSDVLIRLNTVSQMADGASLNEVAMTGSLEKGGALEVDLFLGAYHPANPFRHRRHPSHRGGFDIERHITMTVSAPQDADADFDITDRGVDRLSGVYEEEVRGLHKPLGQSGEFGLRTKGGFVLDRISRDGTLND